MAIFFLDSSALVKRYMPEKGTRWIRNLTMPTAANDILIAQITPVEMISAIARHYHDGQITFPVFQAFRALVFQHLQHQYQIIALSNATFYKRFNFMNTIVCVPMMRFNLPPL